MKYLILTAIIISSFSTLAIAHSGGTDAAGCHIEHRTGIYHCH